MQAAFYGKTCANLPKPHPNFLYTKTIPAGAPQPAAGGGGGGGGGAVAKSKVG